MDDPDTADPARLAERRRDGALVERIRAGDDQAFAELYEVWFDRVHDLAGRILRDPDRAAEVAQDTFLVAWQKLDTLSDPASFGGWLLRITRNRSLNRSEREQRSQAMDAAGWAAVEREGTPVSAPAGFTVERRLAELDDPALVASDHEMTDLVWSTVAGMGERDATVLDLQLRHGLSPAEIGEVLDINRNAANQLVHRVRGRFESALGARVLWDGDEPACDALRAELAEAGLSTFDPAAIKLAERHARTCDECGERRRLRLEPAALFGAVPILVAPSLLKQHVAAALAADGVPFDPAAVGGGSGSGSASDPSGGERRESADADGGHATDAEWVTSHPAIAAVLAAAVLAAFLFGVWLSSDGGPMALSTDAALPADPPTVVGDEAAGTPTTTTVTTAPPTTVPTTPSSTPLVSVPDPGLVDPGPGGPPATTVPPVLPPSPLPLPTASITLAVTPNQMPPSPPWTRTNGPELSWSVSASGPVSIQVTGPWGVSSTLASGSIDLCPKAGGFGSGTVCAAVQPNVYTYRVRVLSGSIVIAERTASLTVL
jgi:RNA polymerase sigma factor (sigma-70 family)